MNVGRKCSGTTELGKLGHRNGTKKEIRIKTGIMNGKLSQKYR